MRKFTILLLLFFHVVLIYFREFTLYPFLASHGFLPYKNIIDQHFPAIFFGPLSLPAFLTVNPWPLLGIFIITLCLTDVLLYATLIRLKAHHPLMWLVFYIVSSSYFSGNVLWIETFINLFLSGWIFLSFSKSKFSCFVSGLLISQILLLRPTILPALIFLIFGLSLPLTPTLILGFVSGFAVPGIYILRHGLLQDFYRLAFDFNGRVYPQSALLLPAKRQIVTLVLWLSPALYHLWKKKKILLLLSLASLLLLIYPRFGYEHLQPLFLLTTIYWALNSGKSNLVLHALVLIFLCLNILSSIRHPYGNYFLSPEVKSISQTTKALPGDTIYLLGASDLIYPLSGKVPPGLVYLPSLPWYYSQTDFVDRVIRSLSDKKTPVLVDYSTIVDGINIVENSGSIYEYIKMNFIEGQKIGNYQIFFPNP